MNILFFKHLSVDNFSIEEIQCVFDVCFEVVTNLDFLFYVYVKDLNKQRYGCASLLPVLSSACTGDSSVTVLCPLKK